VDKCVHCFCFVQDPHAFFRKIKEETGKDFMAASERGSIGGGGGGGGGGGRGAYMRRICSFKRVLSV
jgi:hypothetical protein